MSERWSRSTTRRFPEGPHAGGHLLSSSTLSQSMPRAAELKARGHKKAERKHLLGEHGRCFDTKWKTPSGTRTITPGGRYEDVERISVAAKNADTGPSTSTAPFQRCPQSEQRHIRDQT